MPVYIRLRARGNRDVVPKTFCRKKLSGLRRSVDTVLKAIKFIYQIMPGEFLVLAENIKAVMGNGGKAISSNAL